LHLYIHDYLTKRSFTAAAQALNEEASLGNQTVVPVDAPQGLLYEWWSVFWDVFSAGNPGKAGQPTADAQAYIEVNTKVSRPPLGCMHMLKAILLSAGPSTQQSIATATAAARSRDGSTWSTYDSSDDTSVAPGVDDISRRFCAS
jgi:hypothetical protein